MENTKRFNFKNNRAGRERAGSLKSWCKHLCVELWELGKVLKEDNLPVIIVEKDMKASEFGEGNIEEVLLS